MSAERVYEAIECEQRGRVRIIRLNRPEQLNSLNRTITDDLHDELARCNDDASVGAIIVTGNGRAYCAGADMSIFSSGPSETSTKDSPAHQDPSNPLRRTWSPEFLAAECKPLIAAVNGLAVGGGLTHLLWFDAIVASTEARFSMRFAAIGVTPEISSSWALPRIVGMQKAREMMLTGRIYTAEEAKDFGLVHRIVGPDELIDEAVALAAEIASNPPRTVQLIRRMIFDDYFAGDILSVRVNSDRAWQQAQANREFVEAFRAKAEKREPRFHDAKYMDQLRRDRASGM